MISHWLHDDDQSSGGCRDGGSGQREQSVRLIFHHHLGIKYCVLDHICLLKWIYWTFVNKWGQLLLDFIIHFYPEMVCMNWITSWQLLLCFSRQRLLFWAKNYLFLTLTKQFFCLNGSCDNQNWNWTSFAGMHIAPDCAFLLWQVKNCSEDGLYVPLRVMKHLLHRWIIYKYHITYFIACFFVCFLFKRCNIVNRLGMFYTDMSWGDIFIAFWVFYSIKSAVGIVLQSD